MGGKAPWYGGLLVALLVYAKTRYPHLAELIDAMLMGLGTTWGLILMGHVKNAPSRSS